MAQQRIAMNYSLRRYLTIILALLFTLVALLYAYVALTKPKEGNITAKNENAVKHVLSIYGYQGDLLRRPTGVTLDNQGRILIADTGKNRILVYDQNGAYITQFGDPGKGEYKIKDPIGVAVAPDGRVFVLSKTLKKIVIYNSQFQPINEIGFDEAPLSMTISNQKLYVTTISGIMVGDLEGNLITTFGKRGTAPGQFQLPGGIAVDKDGTMYIADSLNYRVQALSKDGDPLWQYGKPLPPDKAVLYQGKDRKFGLPASIALDDNGFLYVVDGLSSEIVILNKKGKEIDKIGDIGHADGLFYYPAGITYAGQGKLLLADKFNDRVQIFETPFAPTASAQIFAWLPYALLLIPLIGLTLIFSLRSKPKIIASADFLQSAFKEEAIDLVGKAFGKIIIAPDISDAVSNHIPDSLQVIVEEVDENRINKITPIKNLSKTQLIALEIAKNLKGKKVLLTDSKIMQEEAKKYRIKTLSFSEFMKAFGDSQLRKEAS